MSVPRLGANAAATIKKGAATVSKCPFAKHVGNIDINMIPNLIPQFGHMCSFLKTLENELTDPELQRMKQGILPALKTREGSKCPMSQAVKRCPSQADGEAPAPQRAPGTKKKTCPFRGVVRGFEKYRPFQHAMPPREASSLDARLKALKHEGNYREFINIERDTGAFPRAFMRKHKNAQGQALDGEKPEPIAVWCTNDYLGMGVHPEVVEEVREAVRRGGTGAGGTRNISGTSHYITELEKKLAEVHKKEAALVFGSGYVANVASLGTLPKLLPGCEIFSDSKNHASMIDGMRQSKCPKHVWRHNDLDHLEELLQAADPNVPKIIAMESVYSMDGDIGHIQKVGELAKRFNAITYIDEVHAIGMYGRSGGGICDRDGTDHYMTIVSGTMGKALGNYGGYVCGPANVIDTIRCYAPSFIFTTALPPSVAAGTLKSLEILGSQEGEQLRIRHQTQVAKLKNRLLEVGLPIIWSESHIVPVIIGDPVRCKQASNILMEKHKIYVQPINYPTVPKGTERFRLTPGPHHSDELIEQLVSALLDVWHELDLPRVEPNSALTDEKLLGSWPPSTQFCEQAHGHCLNSACGPLGCENQVRKLVPIQGPIQLATG